MTVHTIGEVAAQDIPDPEQRAIVAIAIILSLPITWRQATIKHLNDNPCH